MPSPPLEAESPGNRAAAYWRRNLRYLVILLAIWFAISFGAGIFLADALNAVRIPGTGFKLGFWFAQQGSIYGFLALILAYVLLMNRLDRRMGVDEEPIAPRRAAKDPRRVVGERI
ncbi:MAG TPA: DUF4212 domain-containing protein [Gemmatimonadaceae bacterium]|nr:DUF4212 domain-containing protein [Gemmatimonadaceae bacterium]